MPKLENEAIVELPLQALTEFEFAEYVTNKEAEPFKKVLTEKLTTLDKRELIVICHAIEILKEVERDQKEK